MLTRSRSLSCDSLMLAMHILFCSCPCKICSQVSDALSQALCNFSLAFLANFALSDSTAPIPLIVKLLFSRKLHSAFHLDRKTRSQRSHVFRLTGTAALHCRWPIIELAKNVSPKNKMAASHDVKKFKVSFRPVMGYAQYKQT